jgi:nicotinamidase-related amidase/type 1 glutamine amidotransferase
MRILIALPLLLAGQEATETFTLKLRSRTETEKGSGRWHATTRTESWEAKKTAVIICDMWDRHWCAGATKRVGEMAPRMNEVVREARRRGALVIHCPSDTMKAYEGTPQRKLAQEAPKVETKVALERWRKLDPAREGALPIDDSDGGCDDEPRCKSGRAWSRQIDAIEVKEGDAVTDSAEAFYLMGRRGITHVLVMGVHTNMCVLGRPFSIRQMVLQGKTVALVRDMTDTMYNSRKAPTVSHFTGTDLVVEHIEKHWCPTTTSADLIGGREFRFPGDARPHLAILIGEEEYKTNETLPAFALKDLGRDFRVTVVHDSAKDKNDFPGLEVLDEADLLLVSVRRRTPPKAQMDAIRRFVAAGKPVAGIRTASHAFEIRQGKVPEGCGDWPAFDKEVLGCDYVGHHGANLKTRVKIGGGEEFEVASSLYRSSPLAEGAKVLATGRVEGKPEEPVAWTLTRKEGGRVFYTSLGAPGDFDIPAVRKLIKDGLAWAAGLP